MSSASQVSKGATMEESDEVRSKIITVAIVALFLGIVGTVYIMYYLGIFSNVQVQKAVAPDYRLAYIEHRGPYNQIDDIFKHLEARLKDTSIHTDTAAAVFLDDASTVDPQNLRSKVGFLVQRFDHVPEGIETEEIESRTVLQAIFHGSAMVGSYKAYSAMKEWCRDNGYQPILPSMEIYHADGSVEYQLHIVKKG